MGGRGVYREYTLPGFSSRARVLRKQLRGFTQGLFELFSDRFMFYPSYFFFFCCFFALLSAFFFSLAASLSSLARVNKHCRYSITFFVRRRLGSPGTYRAIPVHYLLCGKRKSR